MQPEQTKEKLRAEAFHFLSEQKVGVLATVAADGTPRAATIFYYVDLDFQFYFFTHDQTEKFKSLQNNAAAALTVFTQVDPVIVQARGLVSVVTEDQESKMAISKLTNISVNSSKWFDPPISKIKAGELKVVKLTATWLRYADFRQLRSSPSPFHELIP